MSKIRPIDLTEQWEKTGFQASNKKVEIAILIILTKM